MKTFTISAIAALMATLTQAAPSASAPKEARVFYASLTFSGAGPNPPTYFLSEPADSSEFYIGESTTPIHRLLCKIHKIFYVFFCPAQNMYDDIEGTMADQCIRHR